MSRLDEYMMHNGITSSRREDMEPRIDELERKNAALEEQNAMLLECLLEMSEIVYA